MTDPLAALKAALPGLPRDALTQRLAPARTYTPDEALQWLERVAQAVNHSTRLPIHATSTRNPDGTLTIHATPHNA